MICRETFYRDDYCVALSTNTTKRLALIKDISSADDEVSRRTKRNENDVPAGKQDVLYHKYCRSKYHYSHKGDDESGRRKSLKTIDNNNLKWNKNCMICGKPCDSRTKRDETCGCSLVDGMNKEEVPLMYDTVMAAAILKDDYIMITRLHEGPNKDLVAYDA